MTEPCGLEPLSAGGGWMIDESLFRLLLDLEIHIVKHTIETL